METLTVRQLNRATLARQLLLQRADLSPVAAVERLCGMQAQEPKPPFIGLWTRLSQFRREDLLAALHARTVVRATLMRGTIHHLSARDYLTLRMTLQPMLTRAAGLLGDRAEGVELETVLPVAHALLAERPRTFNELRPLLVEAFPHLNDRALGYVTRVHVPLVMIPTEDRWGFPADSRFGLAAWWLGAAVAAEAHPDELVRRYLAAFGPATAADMQAWSGLQAKDLKGALEAQRPHLLSFRDERRRELFDLPEAPRPDAGIPAPPRFLPAFDNLVLSHADRTRVLPDEHRHMVLGSKNLRIPATFLVDGFVAGTWRVERKRQAATLRVSPFAPLPNDVADALATEGEALLRFVEEDAEVYGVEVEE
jgi:hypothetical protein